MYDTTQCLKIYAKQSIVCNCWGELKSIGRFFAAQRAVLSIKVVEQYLDFILHNHDIFLGALHVGLKSAGQSTMH